VSADIDIDIEYHFQRRVNGYLSANPKHGRGEKMPTAVSVNAVEWSRTATEVMMVRPRMRPTINRLRPRPHTAVGMRALFLGILTFRLVASGERTARAAGFDLDVWKPSATSTGYICEESARILSHRAVGLGMTFGYSRQPLVLRDQTNDDQKGDIVKDRFTGFVAAAFGIADRMDIGVRIPVVLHQSGDVDVDIANGGGVPKRPRATALGDLDLLPRVRLVGAAENRGFRLTFMAPLGIPTGARDALAGSGGVSFRPRLIAGWEGNTVSAAVSVGYELRRVVEIPTSNVIVGNALVAGIGTAYGIVPQTIWVLGELGISLGLAQSETATAAIPAEALIGVRALLPGRIFLQVAEGTGLGYAAGSPRFRALLTLAYVWETAIH
jgi:OmpA-OmpF porin, OOP family